MNAQTVRELIDRQAAQQPDAIYALATESHARLSFGELRQGCAAVAAWLERQGVGPGQTVSLVMPNGLGTMRVLLGALWGGRCVNPVNLLAQPDQMRYVIDHSDCKVVVASPDWQDKVQALVQGLDRPVKVLVADPDALVLPGETPTSELAAEPAPDALGLLMYTSGTTGKPKGVMLTQANLAANAQSISVEHALSERDRVLGVLPLYHINAFAVTMLAPLAHGGSVAMAPKFSVARFWDQAIDSGLSLIHI